jgi:hypothetical protein
MHRCVGSCRIAPGVPWTSPSFPIVTSYLTAAKPELGDWYLAELGVGVIGRAHWAFPKVTWICILCVTESHSASVSSSMPPGSPAAQSMHSSSSQNAEQVRQGPLLALRPVTASDSQMNKQEALLALCETREACASTHCAGGWRGRAKPCHLSKLSCSMCLYWEIRLSCIKHSKTGVPRPRQLQLLP